VRSENSPRKNFFNINYIAWLPDQSGLLVTALKMPDKSYRIWHVSAANGEAIMLTADSETYSQPNPTQPQGRWYQPYRT
jgi:hypothetical protein